MQISQQLATMSNGSQPDILPLPSSLNQSYFQPTTSALVCNTLWFLSLAFSLTCALTATLVEQWARNYLQATESRPTPQKRARICAYLYQGLQKFGMATVVEAIPLLLHISLLLFFAGLVEFYRPVNSIISYLALATLAVCVGLYTLTTFLPIFYHDCPYRTPLSNVWWRILQTFRLLRRLEGTMAQAREQDATEISSRRDERDLEAMCWTMESLREDSELEPFVEVIPKVVSGYDYSAKLLLHKLLDHEKISARLGYRLPRLLMTCAGGLLDQSLSQKRATTCLTAIWSLSMMSLAVADAPLTSLFKVRFGEPTLKNVETIKNDIPAVANYAISTTTAIARSLLDMYADRAVAAEGELVTFQQTQNWQDQGSGIRFEQWTPRHPLHVISKIKQHTVALEQLSFSKPGLSSPVPYVMIGTLWHYLEELVVGTVQYGNSMRDTLQSLLDFRRFLNQAGFSLTMDFVSNLLTSSSLPYEPFSTIRRLFVRLDFSLPVTPDSQSHLVAYLDEALEHNPTGETRLPKSIINVLLGFVRTLDDPGCIIKARSIVTRYMIMHPTSDAAQNALSVLEECLPGHDRASTLEIFSLHLNANAKLDKTPTQSLLVSERLVSGWEHIVSRSKTI